MCLQIFCFCRIVAFFIIKLFSQAILGESFWIDPQVCFHNMHTIIFLILSLAYIFQPEARTQSLPMQCPEKERIGRGIEPDTYGFLCSAVAY